jgi:hypothetical protein
MRLAVVILFVWCGVVGANPLVLPRPAYIAYERLTVEISPSEARFQGKFVFRFTPTKVVTHKDYGSANMAIPVWFPIQSEGDSSVTNLWRLFALEGWNPIRTFQQRQAFEQSVGMTVIVGSKPRTTALVVSWPRKAQTSVFPNFRLSRGYVVSGALRRSPARISRADCRLRSDTVNPSAHVLKAGAFITPPYF